jgi:hypothetical protein
MQGRELAPGVACPSPAPKCARKLTGPEMFMEFMSARAERRPLTELGDKVGNGEPFDLWYDEEGRLVRRKAPC